MQGCVTSSTVDKVIKFSFVNFCGEEGGKGGKREEKVEEMGRERSGDGMRGEGRRGEGIRQKERRREEREELRSVLC